MSYSFDVYRDILNEASGLFKGLEMLSAHRHTNIVEHLR